MKVKECMNRHVIAVSPEETVASAARVMARYNVGALPVRARDGSLCGIVTDRDMVLRCMAIQRPAEATPVARVMTDRVAAVSPDTSLTHAAALMSREQVRRLPVIEGRRLVGMVTLSDLSHREDYTMEAAETLSEITANVKNL